jgi:hypothetical protein
VAWLVRRATRSWFAALAAALLYLIHAGGLAFGGFWATAQAEVFMDLPLALAIGLVLAARRASGGRVLVLASAAGLSAGLTVLLKYSAAPLLALGLLVWLRPDRSRRERRRASAAFAAGFVLPLAALAAGVALAGIGGDFWRATVTFNAAHRAASTPSPWPWTDRVFFSPFLLLALYAPAAAALLAARTTTSDDRANGGVDDRALAAAAFLAWVLALAQVVWQGKHWIYHYHVILLPLALLAGVGLGRLLALARPNRSRATLALAAAMLVVLALPSLWDLVSYDRAHHLSARWMGRATPQEMEATYVWGGLDYEYAQTKAAAERVRADTAPTDRILVWGFEPYVYFLAEREPATKFLYDYPLSPRFASVHDAFARQFLEDFDRHPPARVLMLANDANDIEPDDSATQLRRWDAMRERLEAAYEPAWRVGDFFCLARRTAPASPPPAP